MTSPRFSGRVGRAHARLAQVKEALKRKNFSLLAETVLDEALDMHALFQTSDPPFQYMNDDSRSWVEKFKSHDSSLPACSAFVTLDAGANVHVFTLTSDERIWDRYFQAQTGLKFLKSKAGSGARYVET